VHDHADNKQAFNRRQLEVVVILANSAQPAKNVKLA
jgi:hypothetical protein